jgi:hypothetical protein
MITTQTLLDIDEKEKLKILLNELSQDDRGYAKYNPVKPERGKSCVDL